nr:hypothetical protein [Tanacetum cinerariifolium]
PGIESHARWDFLVQAILHYEEVSVVFDETGADVRLGQVKTHVLPLYQGYLRLGNQTSTLKFFDHRQSLVVLTFVQSVAPSVGPAIISPVKTKSITAKLLNLLFRHEKRERRITTIGFLDINPFTQSKRGEEYDEEREMEPKPTRVRETTPVLRTYPCVPEDKGEELHNLRMLQTGMGVGLKENMKVEGF